MLVEASHRLFVAVCALLFAGSVALTVAACDAMSAMHVLPMPGGWTLSMMWMRMPGQTWPGMALDFLGMWLAMMIAMMLPSLLPMLWRYRQAASARGTRLDQLTAVVAAAYFGVWTLSGAVVFIGGAIAMALALQWPALARIVPLAGGASVVAAGVLQFSAWKARHLACCRGAHGCEASTGDAGAALRHGLRLGLHCVHCCCGPTLVLLALGMMDLRVMALVTAAICAERLIPGGARVAHALGAIGIAAGVLLVVRAASQW